jgi:acetyl-CoA carboxylase biotin carboxyl carrier protein
MPTEKKAPMPKFDIDDDLIKKLAALLNETGLGEIEYGEGEKRVRVARGGPGAPAVTTVHVAPVPTAAAAPTADINANAVKSPMVGTVYLAPQPGAKQFAPAGSKVKPGDTLMIIEAMKVMNPIKATKAGTVAEILVQDAQPVEFGQPLVVIE